MKVFIEKTGKTAIVRKGFAKAYDLLKELKINPDSVLIVRNNEVILAEEPVSKDDEITLLSVVSGG